jgi:hypothetical protein
MEATNGADTDATIDKCIWNNTHFDIANIAHKYLKDKHRYVNNNTWEYLNSDTNIGDVGDVADVAGTWKHDANGERLMYSIRTIVCRAFTNRALYWANITDDERYPDTEVISNKLLSISLKLKDKKYICALIKECKQFFFYEKDI